MKDQLPTNDEIIASVRGISLKDFSTTKDLEYAIGIFELKVKQMREEIRKRKAEGKE